ncbi:M23 family metallopeptidase [Mangrovimonas sp. YM274]|uniref:M23 family metallopeptidase n=1 Tax=Mangrovimonas sp. YM274 TaxID=3070660 RepID=UPI0027DD67BA|nr:M23 family metallopeptidase [Mangrovimonas sp. YM274]WMI67156.1 M23 family metallopeptidase [Mangrovimonas sp. YM274]
MKKVLFFLLSSCHICFSQSPYPQDYFRNPMEIPIVLAGTFAELRPNHFHAGLDIKTQHREGLNIHTAAPGYVSRIKISHYGYGKALYVTHPNGYTTVYAHLQKFSDKIEKYIKECQYQKESYQVEVFPTPDELPIAKDEIIALSGNTGGSSAPHLHFEIRDNEERPMNPMLFGMDVSDSRKPTINGLFAYVKNENSHINGSQKRKELRLIPTGTGDFNVEEIEALGEIGFGINAHDRLDDAPNKNGVSNIQSFYNGSKHFEIDFKRFSYSETKHINRLIDFENYKTNHNYIQKLFVEQNNPLSLYKDVENSGYVKVLDSTSSVYKIRVKDFKENDVWITIPIKGKDIALPEPLEDIKPMHYALPGKATNLEKGNISVYIPKGTFYDDTYLDFDVKADTLLLGKDIVPLQKPFTITYDISNYLDDDKEKLYIAELTGYYKTPRYVSTSRQGESLSARSKSLGTYTLESDLVPPTITPVNFYDGKWMSNATELKVKIGDKDSGISNYRATINGKWILMEYEYKKGTLTYNFEDNVISDTENNLKVIVTDNVGNSSTFEATFFRK